ncbi:GNAT family N-acetyltransferase [Pseudochrobactrum asaccharolyticum]|uniref:GNAT family N-acetyltransferase n=1 Tax=Pseudochrobactrum asaccharolyticum TaxID=354351 RepID=UPI00404312BB
MTEIRRLAPSEWAQAVPIITQLRRLTETELLQRVERQSYSGYELIGAFQGDKLIGVMGIRPVHTLARGAHLHIENLVVDSASRGEGIGRAMLEYAEEDARARDMSSVFLDARKEAIPFYEAHDYE